MARKTKIVKTIFIGRKNYRRIKSALGIEFELGKTKLGSSFSIEPPCRISPAVNLKSTINIGAFSYFSITDGIGHFIHNCDVGRYCSIAAGVWIAPGDHPTSWLSSSPVQYERTSYDWSEKLLCRQPVATREWISSNRVSIGNDVWIGHAAFIRQGIKIGDGAIVAAHAVVVHDVPPFAIVGGCPAKVIKYRFDEETRNALLELKWWDYDLASFGDVDWSDVHAAIAQIRQCIANGAKPYRPNKITNEDMRPYSRSTPFFFEVNSKQIRIKLFWVWLVHRLR